MKGVLCILMTLSLLGDLFAQEIDEDLLQVRSRLDSIQGFTAHLTLDLDISFINMPTKTASVLYERGSPIQFSTEDFAMIPKRGLDFTLREIFAYPFITVQRGYRTIGNEDLKLLQVLPTDDRSQLVLVTLALDTESYRIKQAEIHTKKDGTYSLNLNYSNASFPLPEKVTVSFEMEHLRIPINFMGKDTDIDRKQMRQKGEKGGSIFLTIRDYTMKK